jgi:hypothetical protein
MNTPNQGDKSANTQKGSPNQKQQQSEETGAPNVQQGGNIEGTDQSSKKSPDRDSKADQKTDSAK